MKKMLALLLAAVMVLSMAACAAAPATTPADTPAPAEDNQTTEPAETNETTEAPAEETPAAEPENLTATQQIIKEAEGMTLEELAKKAIEESNGKMFYGVGNSSRGRAPCLCSLSICSPSIPATTWSSSGSSPRTTRSSIS